MSCRATGRVLSCRVDRICIQRDHERPIRAMAGCRAGVPPVSCGRISPMIGCVTNIESSSAYVYRVASGAAAVHGRGLFRRIV
jgi:hypothetical protein